jgi:hypothetical protein
MLGTIVLLVLCALTGIAGIPLILKLIPEDIIRGTRIARALSRPEDWYEVQRFAGWALVAAAGATVLALTLWSGTLLRPFWRQAFVYLAFVSVAACATLWHHRRISQGAGVSAAARLKPASTRPAAGLKSSRRS